MVRLKAVRGAISRLLVRDLMQAAAALAEVVAGIDAAEHQHGHGIGKAWPMAVAALVTPGAGDEDADPGPARGAGIAVGHESGALLMADAIWRMLRCGQAAIESRVWTPGMPKTVSTP